jgi:hypothetical protein
MHEFIENGTHDTLTEFIKEVTDRETTEQELIMEFKTNKNVLKSVDQKRKDAIENFEIQKQALCLTNYNLECLYEVIPLITH